MNINDRTINALQSVESSYEQPENSALKYIINYSPVLGIATISTSTWTGQSAILTSPTSTTPTVTAIISATVGCHKISNKITTSDGETYERVINLHVTSVDGYISGDY